MKRFILFVVFAGIVSISAIYIYRSGRLFSESVNKLSEKQDIAAGFVFAELATKYPCSPFWGLARFAVVMKDPQYLTYMDLFFKARTEKNLCDLIVDRSPAYYDPFFFAALGYFLILTYLGGFQRFWAGSMGVGILTIVNRSLFVAGFAFLYILWVRESMNPESVVTHYAEKVHPVLIQASGITAVTVGLSAIMLSINLIVTIVTFLGFWGRRSITKV